MTPTEVTVTIAGRRYRTNLGAAVSLAAEWPAAAHGRYFFDAPPPQREPLEVAGFSGAVAAGDSCNAERLGLVPHCHGTHTEGIGHVVREPPDVRDCLPRAPLPAWLGTAAPVTAAATADALDAASEADDRVIDCAALEHWPLDIAAAVILRTRRATPLRFAASADYAYLTPAAAAMLAAGPVQHLLIDTPSLDRLHDGGALANHRRYWGLPAGATDRAAASHPRRTATELL
ncbi:MAG: cyclase family protein, partial [Pseudomonadota bacterium]